jgi:hypothetical protein
MHEDSCKGERWKPGVSRPILLLMAGLLWTGTGVMLDSLSYGWLRDEKLPTALPAVIISFLLALLIHHLGFLRIVDKNLGRILPMEGRRCLFSFMPWRSYILIGLMISLGILLRHSQIPKLYLSVFYTAIGTALILSSVRYLRYWWVDFRDGNPVKT